MDKWTTKYISREHVWKLMEKENKKNEKNEIFFSSKNIKARNIFGPSFIY